MNKILLIGHTGFLGSALHEILSAHFHITITNKELLDLSKPVTQEFKDFFRAQHFNYVIIAAAISDVEKCYTQQEFSSMVNVSGTQDILNLALSTNTIPIFFSSDYVFSGKNSPYTEEDIPNPQTVYGRQKLMIENFIQDHFKTFLIFRTSKLMSKTNHPKNILLPIIKNLNGGKITRYFSDQHMNPVFIEDIADVIIKAIPAKLSGLFHLGTRTYFTRYELALHLAKLKNKDENLIEPMLMSEIRFSEIIPTNNMLECKKIKSALNFTFNEVESIQNILHLLS